MSIQSPEVLCEKPDKVRDRLPVKSKRNTHYPVPRNVKVSKRLGNSLLYSYIRRFWIQIIIGDTTEAPAAGPHSCFIVNVPHDFDSELTQSTHSEVF